MRDCNIDLSCRRWMGRVSFGQFRAPIFLAEEGWMKKIRMGSVCVALIGVAGLTAAVYSQEKKDSPAPPKIMHFGDLKWTPIMKGCDVATVAGDPSAEGTPFEIGRAAWRERGKN